MASLKCLTAVMLLTVLSKLNGLGGVSMGDVMQFGSKSFDVVSAYNDMVDAFDTPRHYAAPDTSASAMMYYSLLDKLQTWEKEFADLKTIIIERSQYMEDLVHELESEERVKDEVNAFHLALEAIQNKFSQFRKIVNDHKNDDKNIDVLGNFMFTYLTSGDVETLTLNVYDYVIPTLNSQDNFLLSLVLHFKTLEATNHLCSLGHSPVDYLQALFSILLATELQGAILLVAGTTFLYANQDEAKIVYPFSLPPSEKIKFWNLRTERRLENYVTAFLEAMESLGTDITLCQPSYLAEDSTYLELAGFIQNVVQPFKDHVDWNVDYTHLLNGEYQRDCEGDFVSDDKGILHGDTAVCLNVYKHRRYHFVHLPNEDYDDNTCHSTGTHFEIIHSKAWQGKCYDNSVNSRSTHIVNLLPIEADPYDNKIVTGMKFITIHNILHIQIQQGKLGPDFDVSNVEWKPIDDISDRVRASRLNLDYEGGPSGLEKDIHYAILDQKNKFFEVGDVIAEHGYVVTGLKFQLSPKKRLQLAVIARKFNQKTGKFTLNTPKVILTPDDTGSAPLLVQKTYPLYYSPQDKVKIFNHGYVEFDSSDWATDRGQTTVPFFDARSFSTSPPTPLLGVSTFFQNTDHFAGLISVRYRGLNYTRYFERSLEDVQSFIKMKEDSVYF